jgi:ArsR family transcriptional regulator
MQQLPVLAPECCSPLVGNPLEATAAGELSRVFKALADPVRLRLLSLIGAHAGGEACVCELAEAFDLTQPTISHHLRVLREAGLIDSERRGTWVYYRIRPETLSRLGELFAPPELAPL